MEKQKTCIVCGKSLDLFWDADEEFCCPTNECYNKWKDIKFER